MITAIDAVLGRYANIVLYGIFIVDAAALITLIIEFLYDKAVTERRYIPFSFKGKGRMRNRKNKVLIKMVDGKPQVKHAPKNVQVMIEE